MPTTDAASISGQSTHAKTLSKEMQEENKQELLDRKDDLVFVSPLLRGFALKNKLWRKFGNPILSCFLNANRSSLFLRR
jgi:hypothetical protein